MMQQNGIFQQGERTVSRVVDGETVIVQPGIGTVSITNEVGSFVWHHLDGRCSVQDIVREVCSVFDVEDAQACRDVCEFLEELQECQLIARC